jgi:GNAT superfamily N-acetyltransferase
MKLKIRPLTPDLWPAIEDLFSDSAVCRRCWCMYWRTGPAYRTTPSKDNQAAFRRVVKGGPPPGLIAFDGRLAVGWCQLTPRAALPQLAREWRLKRVDDQPVWSISCFYVRKSHRRHGVNAALIESALKAAKRAKAPALEAYPFDRDLSPSATSTGFASTFARLGFKTVARHISARPIMRHDLNVRRASGS